MIENQGSWSGDENGTLNPSPTCFDAASLHAQYKNRQSDYQHGKKAMQQDFRIRKSRPEADGAERPSLGIASKKEKCREAEKGKRPIARPGNFSCLGHECQHSHRENEDACPVMVVLGPSFFGGGVRARSRFAVDIGFGRERAKPEGLFLRGESVLRKFLQGGASKSWRLRRHAGDDFGAGDAVMSEIRGRRK